MTWEIIEKLKYFFTLSSEKIHFIRELILIFLIFNKLYWNKIYRLRRKKLLSKIYFDTYETVVYHVQGKSCFSGFMTKLSLPSYTKTARNSSVSNNTCDRVKFILAVEGMWKIKTLVEVDE